MRVCVQGVILTVRGHARMLTEPRRVMSVIQTSLESPSPASPTELAYVSSSLT